MTDRCDPMKPSRRAFLHGAAGACAAGVAGSGGCALAGLSAKRRPFKIIDSHVHFYDPSRPQGVPWPPKDDALLYQRTLPEDYRRQAVPQPVDGVVAVEASTWPEDNQWLLDLAARERLIVGVVGNLPLGGTACGDLLKRFAANPLFRGIRVRDGSPEVFVGNRAFLRDLSAAAERGLCFEVHSPPVWVQQAEPLARAVPGLRLIVNHVASAPVTGQPPPEPWRALMKKLSGCPNIFMKVSGLVEGTRRKAGDAPADAGHYRSVLDELWDLFGPDWLLYASNWPVSWRYAPLGTVQNIAMDYFGEKGQDAVDKVFWKNAAAAYRIGAVS